MVQFVRDSISFNGLILLNYWLTISVQIIWDLGGGVTTDGSICTHVLTVKARRTLNFCTALCSGLVLVIIIICAYVVYVASSSQHV